MTRIHLYFRDKNVICETSNIKNFVIFVKCDSKNVCEYRPRALQNFTNRTLKETKQLKPYTNQDRKYKNKTL